MSTPKKPQAPAPAAQRSVRRLALATCRRRRAPGGACRGPTLSLRKVGRHYGEFGLKRPRGWRRSSGLSPRSSSLLPAEGADGALGAGARVACAWRPRLRSKHQARALAPAPTLALAMITRLPCQQRPPSSQWRQWRLSERRVSGLQAAGSSSRNKNHLWPPAAANKSTREAVARLAQPISGGDCRGKRDSQRDKDAAGPARCVSAARL